MCTAHIALVLGAMCELLMCLPVRNMPRGSAGSLHSAYTGQDEHKDRVLSRHLTWPSTSHFQLTDVQWLSIQSELTLAIISTHLISVV